MTGRFDNLKRVSYLRVAREYIAGLQINIAARDAGVLADPAAIDRDIRRALDTLSAVIASYEEPDDVDGGCEKRFDSAGPPTQKPVHVDSDSKFYNAALRLALSRADCDDSAGASGV